MIPRLWDSDNKGFKNFERGEVGVFSTIEGIYPLLLHPQSHRKNIENKIIDGIGYILANTKNGKISAKPEYIDIKDEYCVDSCAYGLYVLTLTRKHLINSDLAEKNQLKLLIDEQIKQCINRIIENRNENDGGWPIRKMENHFPSRPYSTSLVIFSISNCSKEDFGSQYSLMLDMIRNGINFLEKNHRVPSPPDPEKHKIRKGRGWYYTELFPDNTADNQKNLSLNMTAEVVFALGHLVRNRWWEPNPTVLKLIKEGAAYLWENGFNENCKTGEISLSLAGEGANQGLGRECVKYPGSSFSRTNNDIKYHKFEHPFEMMLPALILAPGYSIRSDQITLLKTKIEEKMKEMMKSNLTLHFNLYEYSDKSFSLMYYNYISTLIEIGLDRFVTASEPLRCIVNDAQSCPDVKKARLECPFNLNISQCPNVSSATQECPFNRATNQCLAVIEANKKCPFNGDIKQCTFIEKNIFMRLFDWLRKKWKSTSRNQKIGVIFLFFIVIYGFIVYYNWSSLPDQILTVPKLNFFFYLFSAAMAIIGFIGFWFLPPTDSAPLVEDGKNK